MIWQASSSFVSAPMRIRTGTPAAPVFSSRATMVGALCMGERLGCKSPTEPVAANREPEATAREESIRHIDRIHICREAVWDRSPRRTAVPNASEPLCMPAWSGRVWRPPRSPIFDRDEVGSGGSDCGTLLILTSGDFHGSAAHGRRQATRMNRRVGDRITP